MLLFCPCLNIVIQSGCRQLTVILTCFWKILDAWRFFFKCLILELSTDGRYQWCVLCLGLYRTSMVPCIHYCQSLNLILEKLMGPLISILVLLILPDIELINLVWFFMTSINISVLRISWRFQVWTI